MTASLMDRAREKFEFANRRWLRLLFRRYAHLEMRLRVPDSDEGHVYIVHNAVLNTRLGTTGPAKTSGATCGENGGRTSKGTPCKKKASTDGRCPHHPPALFTVVHEAGDTVGSVELDFGDDASARPVPCQMPWNQVRISVPGHDAPLAAIDQPPGDGIELLSGTRVWSHIILDIKKALNLPPEAHVRIGETVYGADPLWTVRDLRRVVNLPAGNLGVDGRRMEDAMLLEDYGLRPGQELRCRVMC
jgi:hypothetical protein